MLKNKELYGLEQELSWLEEKTIYKRLKEIQIHNGQPTIMAYIYMHDGCNQYEIAKHLGLSRASIGVSIKRLVKSKYVDLKSSKTDKRSTTLHLTALGTKVLVKSDMVLDTYVSEKYKGFTNQELDEYIKLTKKVRKNLKTMYKEDN